MQIFLTILVLILMLGILVSSHEAGHLIMAKCFNVYCLEYSIGFGPKIYSKKFKGGETAYSLRAIPLGGYVSMFGEGVELPDGMVIPTERSLEGVSKWKRALILSAGIMVNLFLSILFVFIYAVAFPSYYTAAGFETGLVDEATNQVAVGYSLWGEGNIGSYEFDSSTNRLYSPYTTTINDSTTFLVDSKALIDGEEYVAMFDVSSVSGTDIMTHITFYKPVASFYPSAIKEEMGLSNMPDTSSPYVISKEGVSLELHLSVMEVASRDVTKPETEQFNNRVSHTLTSASIKNGDFYSWSESGVFQIESYQFYPSFGERLLSGCKYFAYFFEMIGLGLKAIFTFNFSSLGSIVAMGSMINTASSAIGWGRTFFYFGSYLSLNLAIFNLLPFPGLDGWGLLVTLIEKIRKKKISEKVKNTVSFIGLALLMIFGVFIIIKDIISVLGF